MFIQYSYSKVQLQSAINFLFKNNTFICSKKELYKSIIDNMARIASNYPKYLNVSAYGYTIVPDILCLESLEEDITEIQMNILVDSSIRNDETWDSKEIIDTKIKHAKSKMLKF